MMRLDKLLSDLAVASRKELKQMIRAGRVSVNGTSAVRSDEKVDPEKDAVCLDAGSASG